MIATQANSHFPTLFSPMRIGDVEVANRILSSAHGTNLCQDYMPSPALIDYHLERARGGVGLIVLEASRVHPTSVARGTATAVGYDRASIPGYRRITDALHAEGVKVFSQILHQGRQLSGADTGRELWAPSAIPCPINKETPKAITTAEIAEVVEAHATTAANLKEAGVDGIEIHAAHGYLIQGFMSPLSNVREDEYGGSLDNRLRFACEVIDAVREAVGPGFPVGLRLSGDEFVPGGLDLEAMQEITPRLVSRGIDFVSASFCTYTGASYATMIPDMHFASGPFVYIASGLRHALHEAGLEVPVFAVGRILGPEQGEEVLSSGQADMVTMTRALLADPELPRKAREGRPKEIRRCISCNQGCVGSVHLGRPIRCLVNPIGGREHELGPIEPVAEGERRRVLVVGGGPAGLEAARVAALRGHEVTLWERAPRLGGQVNVAVRAENRTEFGGFVPWLADELERLGVTVETGRQATAEAVLAAGFDAVVLAIGSTPSPRRIATDGVAYRDVSDVLLDGGDAGRKVVVLDEDRHFKAAGIAEWLADRGSEVVMVTPGAVTGSEIPTVSFAGLRSRLGEKGVRALSFHDVVAVANGGVTVADSFSGEQQQIDDVDTVIYAGPHKPTLDLADELRDRVQRLEMAGDCVAPRRALEAMREGHAAGRAV